MSLSRKEENDLGWYLYNYMARDIPKELLSARNTVRAMIRTGLHAWISQIPASETGHWVDEIGLFEREEQIYEELQDA